MDLYFKINTDYEELIRMQKEASRLKAMMSDFSGSKQEFDDLNKRLGQLSDSIAKTTEQVEKDFKSVLSLKDVDISDMAKGIEGFDKDILAFTGNLQKYFQDSQREFGDTLRTIQELQTALANTQVTPANYEQIKQAQTTLAEASEEIQRQRYILEQNQAAWQDVANSVEKGTAAQMEHLSVTQNWYGANGAIEGTLAAQEAGLEQIIRAEEVQAQVTAADRMEVEKLGQQALSTIANLQSMSQVLSSMGVVDTGFNEQVTRLEESALKLGGTTNVEVAQQIANEVAQVFERAMAEWNRIKEQGITQQDSAVSQMDADYRLQIDKEKANIQAIQERRAEEKQAYDERLAQLQQEKAEAQAQVAAWKEELGIQEARKQKFDEINQAIAAAKANGEQSIQFNGSEVPVKVAEDYTAANNNDADIAKAREQMAGYREDAKKAKDAILELQEAEARSASEAQAQIQQKTQLISQYRQELSETAAKQLRDDEMREMNDAKELEREREKKAAEAEAAAARQEAIQKNDADTLRQIEELQKVIDKEKERLEVMRQQAEQATKNYEQTVQNNQFKPSDMVTSFVGGGAFAKADKIEAAGAEMDAKNSEYSSQSEAVRQLQSDLDGLVGKLSEAGAAQYEETEKIREAKAEREALIQKMQESTAASDQNAAASKRAGGALSETSDAMKRMNLDNLKQMVQQSNTELDALAKKLLEAKKAADNAEGKLMVAGAKLQNGGDDGQIGKLVEEYKEAQAQVAATKNTLSETAEEYNKAKAYQTEINAELQKASEHHVRMRTQIMNAREELMKMIAAGQSGTPEFYKMAQHAGSLRRQMQLANAQMQYFANPQRSIAQMKTTLQGVAGGFGMVTGLMGLFNSKSEKMAEIQTKVQSVMAIVVGLETTYNLIKKTSIARIGLEIAAQSLANMARGVYAVVTGQATAAQIAFNAAMSANPLGAIIVVALAVAGAIYGIAKALSTTTEEEQAAKAATEAMASSLESSMKSAANKINTLNRLRATYNANKNDLKKLTTEIINNKEAQNELGITLKTVDDVHQFFTKHADAFVRASQYRAMALAAEQAEAELLGKTMAGLSKILNRLANGQEVNVHELVDLAKEVGITEKRAKELAAARGFYEERVGIFARNNLIYGGKKENMQQASAQLMTDFVEEQRNGMVAQILDAQRQWNTAQAEMEEATYSDFLKKNQTKAKTQKQKAQKSDHSESDAEDRDLQRQENERKKRLDAHKKRLQEELKVETDAAKKRKIQRDLDLLDSKEYFRDLELQRIAQEKKEYDAQHKKDKKKVSYYDTAQYKAHFLSEKDRFSSELNEMNLEAYESEMKFFANLIELESKLGEAQELNSALKALEKYYDARVQVERKYLDKREELRQAYEKNVIDEDTFKALSANVDREEQADKNKASYEKFKNNPLFSVAMMSDNTAFEEMQNFRDEFNGMMESAMENATVADFKGILDSYVQLTNAMIDKNPFGEMKAAAEDLYWAQSDLEDETATLAELYEKFGLDSSGNIGDADGEMAKLQKGAEDSTDAFVEATRTREKAQQELAEATSAYTTAADEGKSKDELDALAERQKAAAQAVSDALDMEANARSENQKSLQAYAAAQNQVTLQEDKVRKKGMEVQAQQKRSDTATKKSIETVKKWAGALKSAASEFSSPIATAISGMVDLTTTTIDSIQKIKKASDASVEGIGRTAQAVTKAVAILAIIQAAWQVINTIMSLFTGKGEKEYQQHISSLKGQVEALDYTFNALKEDMDKAWGTDAINAYIQAVETLNDKQRAQIELIRDQAAASHGHHSLTHYMKKQSGITDKELEDARNYIKQLGGDVSGAWVTDWLYSLTAEQLREFMKSGIGTTIMGKLGGVKGTGDYSGDDWLSDMQAFADTAKTVEDLADEMAEKLNGISLDGLKDEFKSLVTTFETSFNDINNSFDEFMREGMYNNMRTKYDDEMKSWYEELNELNKQRAEGMDEEEYRKRLAELRERYQKFVKQAQDEYQQSLTDAGVNVKNLEQSATTGGFEAMSEDTGTELNGRFAAMQAQETVTAENTGQLLVITGSMHDIASELRDVQVNSYLELREISENTRKVVEPILTMQEDIKKIKENTESL